MELWAELLFIMLAGSNHSTMKKLSNHIHEFGSSGGVAVCEKRNVLFCAGYDLDTGHSMINGNY